MMSATGGVKGQTGGSVSMVLFVVVPTSPLQNAVYLAGGGLPPNKRSLLRQHSTVAYLRRGVATQSESGGAGN